MNVAASARAYIFLLIMVGSGCVNTSERAIMINGGNALTDKQRLSLIAAAQAGDAQAAYRLMAFYCFYRNNNDEGTRWLQVAAKLGHVDAQFFLGESLRKSKSPDDREEGLIWIKKSAAAGNTRAQERLTLIATGHFPEL